MTRAPTRAMRTRARAFSLAICAGSPTALTRPVARVGNSGDAGARRAGGGSGGFGRATAPLVGLFVRAVPQAVARDDAVARRRLLQLRRDGVAGPPAHGLELRPRHRSGHPGLASGGADGGGWRAGRPPLPPPDDAWVDGLAGACCRAAGAARAHGPRPAVAGLRDRGRVRRGRRVLHAGAHVDPPRGRPRPRAGARQRAAEPHLPGRAPRRPGAAGLGVMLGAWGRGAALGALAAGIVPPPKRFGPLLSLLCVWFGLGTIAVGLLPALTPAAIVMTISGVGTGVVNTYGLSWLQRRTLPSMQGR